MSGLLSIESITILIPWKTVPAQLFFSNSLRLIGLSFFNISFACKPLIFIIALEWEISVTAKFSLLHFSLIVSTIFSLLEIINQVFGAFQRILVSLLDATFEFSMGNLKLSICIVLNWIFDLLYWTTWIIFKCFTSEIWSK